jgi:hypothetical protein
MRYRSPVRHDTTAGEPLLVNGNDAPRLTADRGAVELTQAEAEWLVDTTLRDEPAAARQLALELEGGAEALFRLDDDEVRERILGGLASGELVGVRAGDEAGAGWGSGKLRDLVRAIARQSRGWLELERERYQLVVSDGSLGFGHGAEYSVVERERAERILRQLAEAGSTPRVLAELLFQALASLASTSRAGPSSRGLVLVRPRRAAPIPRTVPEPALTPSQMKRAMGGPADDAVPSERPFPPASIEQDLQVQALLDAAELAAPFCEECEKARAEQAQA